MENAGYILLSRQTTLRRQLDKVANNVANLNTIGFKGEKVRFQEYLEKTQSWERLSFVQDREIYQDKSDGAIEVTNNPLDLAINGEGYFVLNTSPESGAAVERFTRNGHFQLNQNREIINASGFPLLDQNGQAIAIPDNVTDISITGQGQVSGLTPDGQNQNIGVLRIVAFGPDDDLVKVRGNLFAAPDDVDPRIVEEPKVVQGGLEKSNVTGVVEITNLIQIQQEYARVAKALQQEHSRQQQFLQRMGRG